MPRSERSTSPLLPTVTRATGTSPSCPDRSLDTVDTIAKELRRYPGENGALALISVAEDFVLMVRAQGSLVRVLLSDATAATDWSLARSAIDHIGIHVDDEDDQAPAGDLAIFEDMGMTAAGHGCAARRLRPLPRGDPQRRRRQRGLRHRSSTTWSASRGDGRRSSRPVETVGVRDARCPRPRPHWPPTLATCRSEQWSLSADGEVRAPATTSASATATRPATPRSWRCARRPHRSGQWRLDRLHPGRHPRALHHVCGRSRAGPGRPRRVRGVRREGGRGRIALGRRTRPAPQPSPRGHRRRPRGRRAPPCWRTSSPPPHLTVVA